MQVQVDDGARYVLDPRRLFVAGFTGRDADAVNAHIEELRALGVEPPASTPSLMELDPSLVTTAHMVEVVSATTSGEVEPVLLVVDDGVLLAVGSDHTDRELERLDIAESKAACPKVVSTTALRLDSASTPDLDAFELSSWSDGDPVPYQHGTMAQISRIPDLLAFLEGSGVELTEGDVVFLGTIPVADGAMRFGRHFRAEMRDPRSGLSLELAYEVRAATD